MEKIEVKASSVEKAIEEGLKELGIERENAEIEVLQQGGRNRPKKGNTRGHCHRLSERLV